MRDVVLASAARDLLPTDNCEALPDNGVNPGPIDYETVLLGVRASITSPECTDAGDDGGGDGGGAG